MDRRDFLRLGGAALGAPALASLASCGGRAAGDSRPNILFICTDQFNPFCTGYAGHPLVHTPNIDRLAEAGTVFTNCYSNSPVCVPARAAMFTGLYPHEVGSYDNAAPFDGRVPAWTNRLTGSGYDCRATGKLDFRYNIDYGMKEVNTGHGHDLNPDVTAYFRNPIVPRVDSRAQIEAYFDEEPHHDTVFRAEAERFLLKEAPGLDRPWVQYVGLTSPHPRWVVPRKYFEMYDLENIRMPVVDGGWPPELHPVMAAENHYNRFDVAPFPEGAVRRARAAYYGMMTMLDEWVGTMLDALEKSGEAADTVVVFTADHGEMLGEHGMWFKGCAYDQAARVPLVVSGPGFRAGRRVDAPVSHVDLAATILELAGVGGFEGLRGSSLLPLASGEESGADRWACSELNNEGNTTGVFYIRRGPWKYVYYVGYEPQLFNLEEDPDELDNLASDSAMRGTCVELENLLRSVCDPEQVSAAAFLDQERRLRMDLARIDETEIYNRYSYRMGDEFASRLREQADELLRVPEGGIRVEEVT